MKLSLHPTPPQASLRDAMTKLVRNRGLKPTANLYASLRDAGMFHRKAVGLGTTFRYEEVTALREMVLVTPKD